MKNIGIIYNARVPEALDLSTAILHDLNLSEHSWISPAENLETLLPRAESTDLVVTVGGDGTILRAVNFTGPAGIPIVGSVETLTPDQWDTEFDINLKSIYLMSNAVWPHFKAKQSGVILNTASIAGQIGIVQDAAYCASKAAVIMLTRCMAVDGAPDRIRVNCVCPGFIDTPMIEGFFDDQEDPAAARAFATRLHPLGRLGVPADIANGFLFLASDEAEWVTGTALTIDGGLTAALPTG